ncbi:MAG: DUF3806 domain-containing protein [Calditrichaceae bacterium]|nr:DUF3806 domain-containing protein [Calditrichaceae bacterium]
MYDKTETANLQALGICFGEVLSNELDLHWVEVEDEYGKDPALKYKDTSIIFFPRTMIPKRIENGQEVDVCLLLQQTKDTLEDMIKKGY